MTQYMLFPDDMSVEDVMFTQLLQLQRYEDQFLKMIEICSGGFKEQPIISDKCELYKI